MVGAVEGGPRSLAGLVEATGFSRATAHRLATALEVHGLLRRTRRRPLRPRTEAPVARSGRIVGLAAGRGGGGSPGRAARPHRRVGPAVRAPGRPAGVCGLARVAPRPAHHRRRRGGPAPRPWIRRPGPHRRSRSARLGGLGGRAGGGRGLGVVARHRRHRCGGGRHRRERTHRTAHPKPGGAFRCGGWWPPPSGWRSMPDCGRRRDRRGIHPRSAPGSLWLLRLGAAAVVAVLVWFLVDAVAG